MLGQDIEVFECAVCKVKTQHTLQNKAARVSFNKPFSVKRKGGSISLQEFSQGKIIFDAIQKEKPRANRLLFNEKNETTALEIEFEHLLYRCVVCEEDTYFLVRNAQKVRTAFIPDLAPIFENVRNQVIFRYPLVRAEVHDSVPESVRNYLIETEDCFAIGACNATATIARLVIDEIARLFQASGHDLFSRLDQLKNANILSAEIVQLAHDIRQAGRNAAHAEWQDITTEQAEQVIYTLREIIRELYITPAERQKRRPKVGPKKP
ncbi:MAG: hypothetical protein C0469_13130 [Cyanobacteria bacterium DS2.3.42]|nr:hypothetical protein [Cyanobacteria bacterium DS2.3.42]